MLGDRPLCTTTRRADLMTRKRVLLASIPITPTKPLTPSHVKALFWLDTLYKATSLLHDVTYLYNRRTCDSTLQTVGFWAHLDAVLPGCDFTGVSEQWIGERYVAYHASGAQNQVPELLRRYVARVASEGFLHPVSRRLLEIWQRQYALLGLHDPGLFRSEPAAMSVDETIELLCQLRVGLDARPMGGGFYLDLTDEGLPLRSIIGADGNQNYLFHVLRDLLADRAKYDSVLLLCDEGLCTDYLLLQRVLSRAGTTAERLSLGRVPIAGVVTSARHGGAEAYTIDHLFGERMGTFDADSVRLGARLYFIAGLGRGSGQDFRPELLHDFMARAQKILRGRECAPDAAAPLEPAWLSRLMQPNGCVDPYRFASQLFARHTSSQTAAAICSVLGL